MPEGINSKWINTKWDASSWTTQMKVTWQEYMFDCGYIWICNGTKVIKCDAGAYSVGIGGNLSWWPDVDCEVKAFHESKYTLKTWEDLPAAVRVKAGQIKVCREEDKPNSLNHPSYYGGDSPYEVVKVIWAWELSFTLGNVVKYVARAGKKDPSKEIEDLKKARTYLDREIERKEERKETL